LEYKWSGLVFAIFYEKIYNIEIRSVRGFGREKGDKYDF
jgi:hypothetical protein